MKAGTVSSRGNATPGVFSKDFCSLAQVSFGTLIDDIAESAVTHPEQKRWHCVFSNVFRSPAQLSSGLLIFDIAENAVTHPNPPEQKRLLGK